MIIGIDHIKSYVENNGGIYWQFRKTERGQVMYPSPVRENQTLEDSLQYFDRVINTIAPGDYYLEVWSKLTDKNNRLGTHVRIGNQLPANNAIAGPSFGGVSEREFFELKMEAFKNEMKLQNEINEMKRQNEEGGSIDRLIGKLEPFLPAIIGALTKGGTTAPAPAVTGQPRSNGHAESDIEKQFGAALQDWNAGDPDAINLIIAISELRKSDPETYNMAKQMLMQQKTAE